MSTFYTGDPNLITTPLARNINGATNANPIVISTTANHLFATGDTVLISGVLGNLAANGQFAITVVDATHFSIPAVGTGGYTSGGVATDLSLTPPFQIPSDGDPFTASAFNVAFEALADRTQYLQNQFVNSAAIDAPYIVKEDVLVAGTAGGTLASSASSTFIDALIYSSITGVETGDRVFLTTVCAFEDGGTACILESRLAADDGSVHVLSATKFDFDAQGDGVMVTLQGVWTATSNANISPRMQFRNANNSQTILALGQGTIHYKILRTG